MVHVAADNFIISLDAYMRVLMVLRPIVINLGIVTSFAACCMQSLAVADARIVSARRRFDMLPVYASISMIHAYAVMCS